MKVRPSIRTLVAYPQQAEGGIRMDLNMNIVLPPPLDGILKGISEEVITNYPSQHSHALREALGKRFSVSPAC